LFSFLCDELKKNSKKEYSKYFSDKKQIYFGNKCIYVGDLNNGIYIDKNKVIFEDGIKKLFHEVFNNEFEYKIINDIIFNYAFIISDFINKLNYDKKN
jgi:hypothetical protein